MSLLSRFLGKERPKGEQRADGTALDQGTLFRMEFHALPCPLPGIEVEISYMAVGFCTASPVTSSALALPEKVVVKTGGTVRTLAIDGFEHGVDAVVGTPGNNPQGCGDSN